jgi:hypothetical protein
VPVALARSLAALGHDLLTAHADGRANQCVEDAAVLLRATELGRAVLTNNRDDFHRLHRRSTTHAGIVTYTHDPDAAALAARIHSAVVTHGSLAGLLLRVLRPG